MRFITFAKNGAAVVGVRLGDEVVDLSLAAPGLSQTLVGLLEAGQLKAAHDAAVEAPPQARSPLSSVKHLPVIPQPPVIFAMGTNYGSHVGAKPDIPGFYVSGPERLCGHGEAMVVPGDSATLDYEVELAIVIGKTAKNVAPEDALDYVGGYTIFNDGSVRGRSTLQNFGRTLTVMKNADKTGPLGPELVTPDELPAGADSLAISLRRNGETLQNDNTSSMFWKVPRIIAMCSSYMTLRPGTIIPTGTPGGTVADTHTEMGVKMGDESLPWLRAGDLVEAEIEGIGVLRNPVIAEARYRPFDYAL